MAASSMSPDWSRRSLAGWLCIVSLVVLAATAPVVAAPVTSTVTADTVPIHDGATSSTGDELRLLGADENTSSDDSNESATESDSTESDDDNASESTDDETEDSGTDDPDAGDESESEDENESAADESESTADPTAAFEAPTAVDAGETVTLDASASDAGSDDTLESYAWDIVGGGEDTMEITSTPSLERTFDEPGTVTVTLIVITDADQRAEETQTMEVAENPITVDGGVTHPGGEVGPYDSVRLLDGTETVAETETESDGSFTLEPAEPGTYDLVYVDQRLDDETTDLTTNGNVDLYALDSVTVEDTDHVDLGTTRLPSGHTLEPTVVGNDSEQAFEGVPVTYSHNNNGATVTHNRTTDETGAPLADEGRPLEVAGDIELTVDPPPRSDLVQQRTETSLTVREDADPTVRLPETINATLEVEPESATVGDEVTVTVNETRGEAESITWGVEGHNWSDTTDPATFTGDNRTVDDAALPTTTDHTLERQVTAPENVTVSARVRGSDGGLSITRTEIPVAEPDRDLALEVPERTPTHETITARAVHDGETDLEFETYNWAVRNDDGDTIISGRIGSPSLEFEFEDLGQYTVELEAEDEYGLTDSATATVEADSVPAWVQTGSAHFEIEDVDSPDAVEPGNTVPITVTLANTGSVPDRVDVTTANETDTLAQERLELGIDGTDTVVLDHTAPAQTGNYTLTVATDHERTSAEYVVTDDLEAAANATGEDEGPQELELLPTPSAAAEIELNGPASEQVRPLVLGATATALLAGFGVTGYAIYARPDRDESESSPPSPPSHSGSSASQSSPSAPQSGSNADSESDATADDASSSESGADSRSRPSNSQW